MSQPVDRKLAAILSADVVGYTRLLAQDEAATIRTLTDHRETIALLVRQNQGRVVDTAGDNLLAEFPSALGAVRCAIEVQRFLRGRNADVSAERRMEFRIGVHLGDVRVEGQRIYGDGVNIAARLERLAAPGGVCISATVHEQVRNKLEVGYEDRGDQTVKNVPEQVHVYAVRLDDGAQRAAPPAARRRGHRVALAAGAGLLVLALGLWAAWPRVVGFALDRAGLGGAPVNPPLPDQASIAVLPFANLSDDPAQEYFSDGISEDLTTDLSRNPFLFVISRNSAFTYKGRNVRVEDVGRELGVRYVLEGSVRKAGGRVRITAQLIDATTGFHVWSERYDRDLADIFALQSEISERILSALVVEIPEAELRRIRSKPTDNLNAYDLFQQALFHFNLYTRSDLLEARRLLERAVELDPEYATARGLLGSTYTVEWGFGWNSDATLLDRAEELVTEARALDETSPGPHTGLAAVELFRGRAASAAASAQRAIDLAPSFETAHYFMAVARAQQGRLVDASQSIQRAQRLNPKAPTGLYVIIPYVNLAAGRKQKAVEMFEEVRAANPEIIGASLALASLYELDGRGEQARTLVQDALRVNPQMTAETATASIVESLLGEETAAEWRVALRRAGLP